MSSVSSQTLLSTLPSSFPNSSIFAKGRRRQTQGLLHCPLGPSSASTPYHLLLSESHSPALSPQPVPRYRQCTFAVCSLVWCSPPHLLQQKWALHWGAFCLLSLCAQWGRFPGCWTTLEARIWRHRLTWYAHLPTLLEWTGHRVSEVMRTPKINQRLSLKGFRACHLKICHSGLRRSRHRKNSHLLLPIRKSRTIVNYQQQL